MVPFDDAPLPTKRLPVVVKKAEAQQPILVTNRTESPTEVKTQLSAPNIRRNSYGIRIAISVASVGVVLCLLGLASGLFLYPGILAVCFGASVVASKKIGKPWPYSVAAVTTLVSLVTWGAFDTYEVTWTSDVFVYKDTTHRWTGDISYRKLETFANPSAAINRDYRQLDIVSEGPMSGHVKPHGKWELVVLRPAFESLVLFYWYGENVTEGEWHLRNK